MLDIVIPTYKNKQGLINTLSSINQSLLEHLSITVIDDGSNEDYSDIQKQFSFVNFLYLKINSGPGVAREYGIINTKQPYIMFIDTGDLFISDKIQEEVLEELNKNPTVYLFQWQHIYETTGLPQKDNNSRMHAKVYSRNFINKYQISFCPEGSYANEDIGFNRYCKIILKSLNNNDKYFKKYDKPLILWTVDENSLTKKDNGAFSYKKQNIGLAINEIYVFRLAKINKINEEILINEANEIITVMYYNLLETSEMRPEFLQNSWQGVKLFYDTIFQNYENNKFSSLQLYFSSIIKKVRKNKLNGKWKKDLPVNINQFFKDLKEYQEVPQWYKGE